jgi:carbonic anhydrase
MEKLVQGVHFFQNIGYRQHSQLFERLKDGQEPEACMITCADSRIDPNLITNSQPGQLFIIRNVGNIIPCYGNSNNSELAAVEYAVVELGIEDLIVCGHSGCGAMKALVASPCPETAERLPSVCNWLRHADATLAIIRAHYGHLTGDALVKAAAEENVLVQLEHLRTLPVIAARLAAGQVRLHGWMYKIDSGEVFNYDADVGQFVRFGTTREQIDNGAAPGGALAASRSRDGITPPAAVAPTHSLAPISGN